MITEDYVSFEVAKLLKEKGFDEKCISVYHDEELQLVSSLGIFSSEGYDEQILTYTNSECEWSPIMISAPTLQMAIKWLRETHNIDISVVPHSHKENKAFDYEFVYWNGGEYHVPYDEKHPIYHEFFGKTWKKYEEACEAAIKYCLENLI